MRIETGRLSEDQALYMDNKRTKKKRKLNITDETTSREDRRILKPACYESLNSSHINVYSVDCTTHKNLKASGSPAYQVSSPDFDSVVVSIIEKQLTSFCFGVRLCFAIF